MEILRFIKLIKNNWLEVCKIAIAYFFLFLLISWLDQHFGLRRTLSGLSTETYLTLGGTVATFLYSKVSDRIKKRDALVLAGQQNNQRLIEESYTSTVKTIQELEGRIDEIRLALNTFEVLAEKDQRHEAELVSLRSEFAEIRVAFADLNQRQRQGDRLMHFSGLIGECLTLNGELKTELYYLKQKAAENEGKPEL